MFYSIQQQNYTHPLPIGLISTVFYYKNKSLVKAPYYTGERYRVWSVTPNVLRADIPVKTKVYIGDSCIYIIIKGYLPTYTLHDIFFHLLLPLWNTIPLL